MQLKNGKFELTGFPENSKAVSLDTKKTQRMNKIRHAQSNLMKAKKSIDLLKSINEENIDLQEVIALAACTYYFSCFQAGTLSPRLLPKKVFSNDLNLLYNHNQWRKVRDNRFNHPDKIGISIGTVIIVDQYEKFLDLKTIIMDVPIGQQEDKIKILNDLISRTQEFLAQSAECLLKAIKKEYSELTKQQISSLVELTIRRPDY